MMTFLMIMFFSMIFIYHPFPFMLITLMTSIMTGIFTYFSSNNSMISMIFIIFIVGGLMILMLYMTSLYSYNKMSIKWPMILILFMMLSNYYFMNITNWNMNINSMTLMLVTSPSIYLFLCFYLLIMLLSAMKIIYIKSGPFYK